MIEIEPPTERALLVAAPLKRGRDGRGRPRARHATDEHLAELQRLIDTAGARVVGAIVQQLDRPNPATYLGSGKIEELRAKAADLGATLVVFDDDLSPAQGKNIEDALAVRVMDRTEVILDIFATRARSSEAKMQVELAQLQYMLPRLTRMWAHLERYRGGIGMRGPGETQLETDRRLINSRMRTLKQRLADVEKSREVRRRGRRDAYRVALVGYTNAGKSSILRALSGASDVFVEDRLFATLDPLTRTVTLDDGANRSPATELLLTDTVGFIRKLPHNLVASFRATLSEVNEADLLLHVIDASHAEWENQAAVVDEVLAEIGAQDNDVLHVFNKTDRLPADEFDALRERVERTVPSCVFVSAIAPGGLEPLRAALRSRAAARLPAYRVRVRSEDGSLLAAVHRAGSVLRQELLDGHLELDVRMTGGAAARLASLGAGVTPGSTPPD